MLDGPRLAAKSGQAKQLVVFLHGYGADGNDLIDIGEMWRDVLPDAAFVAPHAPEPCGMAPYGRQWFALTFRDPDERQTGVVAARPGLDVFLDAELARHGLDDAALALVGFSQGTMLALHVGLRRTRAPAAILGYSGALVAPERLAEATARDAKGAPPPVFLIHGEADSVVPVGATLAAAQALNAAGISTRSYISPSLDHGVHQDGLIFGARFLAESFGLKPPQ